MSQITMKHLNGVVARLNFITSSPEAPYTKNTDGRFVANVGNYHIDSAYGGNKLVRMVNEGGGISDVLHSGYVSKRELYNLIRAFLTGLEQNDEK